jgi:hypothetical protein
MYSNPRQYERVALTELLVSAKGHLLCKPSIRVRGSYTLAHYPRRLKDWFGATPLGISENIGSWSTVQVLNFCAIPSLQIFCRCPVPFQRRACSEGKWEVWKPDCEYLRLFIIATGCTYGRVLQKSIIHFWFLEDSAITDTERCPDSRSFSWFFCVPSV